VRITWWTRAGAVTFMMNNSIGSTTAFVVVATPHSQPFSICYTYCAMYAQSIAPEVDTWGSDFVMNSIGSTTTF
jgi:hypothetical protein